eukprot:COSAG01_NODE_1648_length_9629_cov_9.733998_4_plen_290_part_00
MTVVEKSGAKKQGGAASYAELLRRCWLVVAATLLLSMHRDIDWQLVPPYFYTRVACCGDGGGPMLDEVVSYAGHEVELRVTPATCQCDLEATFGRADFTHLLANGSSSPSIAACRVPKLQRDHAMWSHSEYCRNFQYVQMEGTTVQVSWTAQIQLWYIPMMACFGKASDIYGRRFVYLWTTVFTVILFVTFTLDARFRLGDWAVYSTAPFMSSYYMHDVVAWSMAVDLLPLPLDQAKLFPLLAPVLDGTVAQVLGDVLAFYLLQLHLVDYTHVPSSCHHYHDQRSGLTD